MNKQLKELVEQAGIQQRIYYPNEMWGYRADIKRFAKLVHQAAMKEAAEICRELNYNGITPLGCAAAIRNRAEEYLKNEQD